MLDELIFAPAGSIYYSMVMCPFSSVHSIIYDFKTIIALALYSSSNNVIYMHIAHYGMLTYL